MTPNLSDQLARVHREEALRRAAVRRLPVEVRSSGITWRTRMSARRMMRGAGLGRLEVSPLFAGLPRRELRRIARFVEPITAPGGDVLVREGRADAQLVILASGTAEATVDGRRVAVFAPGDHLGEMTVLCDPWHWRAPKVTTLTAVEGFVLGRREFWAVVREVPAVAVRLAVLLAERAPEPEAAVVAEEGRLEPAVAR